MAYVSIDCVNKYIWVLALILSSGCVLAKQMQKTSGIVHCGCARNETNYLASVFYQTHRDYPPLTLQFFFCIAQNVRALYLNRRRE